LEHLAIRDFGREFDQFLASRADDVDLRGQGLVERRINSNVSQTQRFRGSG
jgi:hypothetical protein